MNTLLHPQLVAVTQRIEARSAATRSTYLQQIAAANPVTPRSKLSCGNLHTQLLPFPTPIS